MGFTDAYRALHNDQHGYTWWQNRRLFSEIVERESTSARSGLTPVAATIHREWCAHRIAAGVAQIMFRLPLNIGDRMRGFGKRMH